MLRLDKFLADSGLGTRNDVKKLIKSGKITINGNIVKNYGAKVDEFNDIIKNNGIDVNYSKFVYIMLNKPSGVISATEDKTSKTVVDILPDKYKLKSIFPVGRLDKDTVGLLLLTNDGEFAHNTLSPKKHFNKTYFAKFDGKLPDDAVMQFEKGIVLDDFVCKSAILTPLSDNSAEVIIREGKFHQVKRMFKALGCSLTYLKRTAFGEITLDANLKEGEYRELNKGEMEYIRKYCGKE